YGVAERHGVVLAGATDVGDAARRHDLETDEAERLLLRVREHAVGGLVHRPERPLGDEVVEKEHVRGARRDHAAEVPRARVAVQRDSLDDETSRSHACGDGLAVLAAAPAHEQTWPRS